MNIDELTEDSSSNCSMGCRPCLPILSSNTPVIQKSSVFNSFGADIKNGYAFQSRNSGSDGSVSVSSGSASVGRESAYIRKGQILTEGEMLLAKDLESLSMQERERVFDDIHGVATDFDLPNDPDFVANALLALDAKLTKIREKNAYNLALFLFPKHVRDPKLRLMYLYATQFDVDFSAKKIVNMFQKKLDIFGRNKLGKVITLEDLSPSALKFYKAGPLQFYPKDVRDRSGRPVVFVTGSVNDPMYKVEHAEEAFFYTLMNGVYEMTLEEHARGFVGVGHHVNVTTAPVNFWSTLTRSIAICKVVPLRVAGCHMCTDHTSLIGAASLFQVSGAPKARVRVRTFIGSYMETQYYLSTFGIDESIFPLDSTGSLRAERLEELISLRREREASKGISSDIVPTEMDVLIGRGRPFQNHPGNIRFLQLIDSFREEHAASTKALKAKLSERVKMLTLDSGSRFLKQLEDGTGWEVVKDDEARRKVRHGFRVKNT